MDHLLFVYAKGGPPLEHVVPRIAAHARVHVLAFSELPRTGAAFWESSVASVRHVTVEYETGLVDVIVSRAKAVRADAVLTVSECAVVAVARACTELGLPGAGDGAVLARDKCAMRSAWQAAGVPVPRFVPVRSEVDAFAAAPRLSPPLVLKPAWGIGSVAHQIIHHPDETAGACATAMDFLERSTPTDLVCLDRGSPAASGGFILEEIVPGAAADWYTDANAWGDYVTVEGIVAGGEYHPLCITGKLPVVPPFTDRAGIIPAALPEAAQRRIESLSRAAVDALNLSTCATHTKIKLGPGGAMWVIGTAARVGGAMTARQMELAFGIDVIGMVTRELLGLPVAYPSRMPVRGREASASLLVHAAHGDGTPWVEQRVWDFGAVEWRDLLADDSRIAVVRESSLPDGRPMPAYDPAGGSIGTAALCLITGRTPATVNRDCHRIGELLYQRLAVAADGERGGGR
ncbi:acetyl-CoA carboxylase biotin carboxylase subunit family protein [Streptomyces sp. TRM70350]|uniref:ATP-grasp domain-containing protein n=1 Tax=Streptomyces sp. TRM70350 TaxID=2856165 RepID=UPI001C45F7C1|nr:ATP-grasp domain-containing protein [Streptomyces sp. TRM70350]MBV7696552.1 ATP-grasp domain-containing protein [Streptomyces sp. TRM70350]